MKFSDLTFRDIDRRFFVLEDDTLSELLLREEGEEGCKAILYGYVNPDSYVTFDIAGYQKDGTCVFFDDGAPRKAYLDFVDGAPCRALKKTDEMKALSCVKDAKRYYRDEALMAVRALTELDKLRSRNAPDVLSLLVLEGENARQALLRCERVDEFGVLWGRILTSCCGWNEGESVAVSFGKVGGELIAYCSGKK